MQFRLDEFDENNGHMAIVLPNYQKITRNLKINLVQNIIYLSNKY
jgi:hypothetical protein